MKEQEYINVQEKAYLDAAIEILGKIVPANSEILPCTDFIEVRQKLWRWRDDYNKIIRIK